MNQTTVSYTSFGKMAGYEGNAPVSSAQGRLDLLLSFVRSNFGRSRPLPPPPLSTDRDDTPFRCLRARRVEMDVLEQMASLLAWDGLVLEVGQVRVEDRPFVRLLVVLAQLEVGVEQFVTLLLLLLLLGWVVLGMEWVAFMVDLYVVLRQRGERGQAMLLLVVDGELERVGGVDVVARVGGVGRVVGEEAVMG